MGTEEVIEKMKELGIVPIVADWSDKKNWVIAEYVEAMGRSSIPYYPVIPGKADRKIIETIPEVLLPPAAGKAKVIAALEAAGARTVPSAAEIGGAMKEQLGG